MKTTVETLLRQTGRANIDKLLTMMEQHGYYSVPSDRHHQGSRIFIMAAQFVEIKQYR